MSNEVTVYLSGGFHTDWQKRVMKACEGYPIRFLNPLEKETDPNTKKWRNLPLTEEQKEERSKAARQAEWWLLDKEAVRRSTIIFCYLEDYRPKLLGTGAIFELGMAYALDKFVILVNDIEHRYYREFEHLFVSFPTLEEGIKFLQKSSWLRD